MIRTVYDLDVFRLSYQSAMDVFNCVKTFPGEEKYSLTSQLVRASRSVAANIAEGWGRRSYENEFKKHLIYSIGSLEETKAWLLFAKDRNYLAEEDFRALSLRYEEIGAKLYKLYSNWKKV